MHSFNSAVQKLQEDFKATLWGSLQDLCVTQDDIADACGVHQATVSRWFAVGGDLAFPAAFTPALHTRKLDPIAFEIVRFQASRLGLNVEKIGNHTRASQRPVVDEALDISRELGLLIDCIQRNPGERVRIRRHLDAIVTLCQRAILESEK